MAPPIDLDNPIPCNSTMAALVQSAFQLDLPHEKIDFDTAASAGYCQFSTNSTLADEAKDVWLKSSAYGYYPSKGFAGFALAAFGLAALIHLYQLFKSRRWSYIAVILGLALQIFGWYERFAAADDIQVGYVEQLATLTIAPTFFSAALYSLFSIFAASEDPTLLPRFKPRTYMWSFIAIDFVTLIIQAAGGAIAATTDDTDVFNLGCHIMLAGIILQLITTLVFLGVFGVYYDRLRKYRGDCLSIRKGSGVVFWGICAIAALIIIRGGYRTAELSEGLFGPLATEEIALILADAVPMILVAFLLSATHPLHTIKTPVSSPSARGYGRAAMTSEEKMIASREGTEMDNVQRV